MWARFWSWYKTWRWCQFFNVCRKHGLKREGRFEICKACEVQHWAAYEVRLKNLRETGRI